MDKNTFLKISAAIFVFLAIIISLFPPFEFGNEKRRILSEQKNNSKIVDKLPLKKYDFIFGDNKKYIPLSQYDFVKRFYDKDSLEYYKKKWSDKKFSLAEIVIDSFYTAQKILYRQTSSKMIELQRIVLEWDKKTSEMQIMGNDVVELGTRLRLKQYQRETGQSYDYKKFDVEFDGNKIITYTMDKTNQDAINYAEVKKDYEKSPPYEWSFKRVLKFDSIKKYYDYTITQPNYFLLDRKILLSELIIEYFLAFFVSITSGYLIQKIILQTRKLRT